MSTCVCVLSNNGERLMPTIRLGKVRHLLKDGKAKIIKHHPFTIQLLYDSKTNTQPIEICEDVGYNYIGISVKSQSHEYVSAQYDTLQDEKACHDSCRKLRRTRRNRLRYRKPRFDNRKRGEGWLAPSLKHKKELNVNVVKMYCTVKSLEKKRKYDKIIPLFEEGLTIKQIADKYGVTVNTIKAQASARGFDIVKEEANRHNQKVLEMQELRNQGYSVAHIAELFGCTVSTVYRCLAKKVEATIEQLQEVGKKVEEKVEQKVEELAQTAVKTYETVRETCTSIREQAEKKIDCVAARIKAQKWLNPTKEESVAAPERVYYSLKDFLLDDDPPDGYNDIFGCYGMTAREL